jgi:NADPH2:quinone reductase
VAAFGGPETLELREVEDPRAPGPGEVRVRIRAVGVNPVDTYVRAGQYGDSVKPPYTPGSDAAGVVEAVGEGGRRVRPGDRVYIFGTRAGAREDRPHPLAEKSLSR